MKDIPYIAIESSGGGTAAFFAIKLASIATQPENERRFSQRILNQQSDFIATLVGLGQQATAELRFVCLPNKDVPHRGTISIAMRVRLLADSAEEAERDALKLFQSFMPNVLSISSCYQWQAVITEANYKTLFCETEQWRVKELVRRERNIVLDPCEQGSTREVIGFTERTQAPESEKKQGCAYVYFPFLRNYDTFKGLFLELLHQRHATVISVRLSPTLATDEEYQFVLDQLLASERYMQLPLSGAVEDPENFYPSYRTQAKDVGEQLRQALNTLRDDVFMTTVHVMSDQPLPQMLCESIGVAITEHIHTKDPDSDMTTGSIQASYAGGYDWLGAVSELENRCAIQKLQNMEETTFATGLLDKGIRIRRLFGINQASAVFRLPIPVEGDFPGLKTQQVVDLAPPVVSDGVFIGISHYQSGREKVHMQDTDRLRHTYVIGKTGTGKSTFLKNLIAQDIMAGKGVGVFDPHGELIEDVMPLIPPERLSDVVLIEPENGSLAVGLNLLEVETELEKDSVINYLIEVFGILFDMRNAGGPMFEMYFRNALLLLLGDRQPVPTLVDIHRVFEDADFRHKMLSMCEDLQVKSFWRQAQDARGEASLANLAPYITSKLVRITHSHTMRMICCQQHSTIDFKDIIENQKILLVNLSKGELGDTSSYFLGMMLIKMIQTVAFRRKTVKHDERPLPFYMYVDEFQNLATPTFVNLLSESRKYGLAMTLANQYLGQIPDEIRQSIMGNVGSMVNFRVGAEDAKVLANSFEPHVGAKDFINLPNYHAYVSMLVKGNVSKPFNIQTEDMQFTQYPEAREALYSAMTNYTRPVAEIQSEFEKNYKLRKGDPFIKR